MTSEHMMHTTGVSLGRGETLGVTSKQPPGRESLPGGSASSRVSWVLRQPIPEHAPVQKPPLGVVAQNCPCRQSLSVAHRPWGPAASRQRFPVAEG